MYMVFIYKFRIILLPLKKEELSMKKSFVHSGGRLCKTLSLMLFVLLLAIFLGACGNKNDSKNPERIIVSTASKETLALPNGYDKVCAIVKSDENLLIISEKDSSPCVLAFDSNLALFSERKLDIPDKNNAHICGISSNSEGFSILFSSSPQRTAEVMYIGFYDKTGQLKKSIPLNDLTPNYMGPVVTSEGEYLLWNPSTILLFD